MDSRLQHCNWLDHLLRIFFHLLYNQLAWAYDFVANIVSIGQWKEWVLSVSKDLNGPLVLEIGHGPGHLLITLNKMGVHIFGIDKSLSMGNMAYGRIADLGYEPSIARALATNMPFRSASFHQLVATFPSEFILETSTISEAYRVLLPGGKFIILPVVWIKGQSFMERFFAYIFDITGQSPDVDARYALPFAEAGFIIKIEERIVKSGKLLIIHAQKPCSESEKNSFKSM